MPTRLHPPAAALTDGVVRLEPLHRRFVRDFDALTADPDVIRFTRVPASRARGFAASWIEAYVKAWADGSRAGFAILDEHTDAFLGMVALVQLDLSMGEGEVGYIVAPHARGRGVAGRGIRLLAGWAFREVGLARLEAWIDVANDPSKRVVERLGFSFEGIRRSVHFKDGQRADMAVYSLLSGELPRAKAGPPP
ncbi:MAG TPA: GNAT family protein [Gaiellaceae bacterium]|nr:GNAT family protein [Gaiellaceae bacterium]